MKHRKVDRSILTGTIVADTETIKTVYEQGAFRYQFLSQRPGATRSRIMLCDSDKERDWLISQVARRIRIVIDPVQGSV